VLGLFLGGGLKLLAIGTAIGIRLRYGLADLLLACSKEYAPDFFSYASGAIFFCLWWAGCTFRTPAPRVLSHACPTL